MVLVTTTTTTRSKTVRDLTVGECARQIGDNAGTSVPPHVISSLFYKRVLDGELCPVVSRCRRIPPSYVATIESVLRTRGLLPPAEATPCQ
jgi:hypothetical protein